MSTVVDPDTDEHQVARSPDAGRAGASESLACPNCGAAADPGQLMCLECGSRLALDYRRAPGWRFPAALAAIVLLIAGVGIALALAAGGNNNNAATTAASATPPAAAQNAPADTPPAGSQPAPAPTTSAPTPAPAPAPTTTTPAGSTPPSATTPTPTPTPTTSVGWPPGKSAFTVVLASLPSKAAADAKLQQAHAAGISGAAILHSDDFPTLHAGYWVVFDGQYDSIAQAQSQAAADRGKGEFGDAYPRFVSKDANAKP